MEISPFCISQRDADSMESSSLRSKIDHASMAIIDDCEFKDQAEFLSWLQQLGPTMDFSYTKTEHEKVSTINNGKNPVLFPQAGRMWNNMPAGDWHLDLVFVDPGPTHTVLYCQDTPSDANLASTWFCDSHKALQTLSPTYVDLLRHLHVMHYRQPKSRYTQEGWEKEYFNSDLDSMSVKELLNLKAWFLTAMQNSTKPVIQKDTAGRECIYISPSKAVRFDGMTEEESQPIIKFIAEHLTLPEHVYQHRWKKNQLVIWSNVRYNHYGVYDYHGLDRILWRSYLR